MGRLFNGTSDDITTSLNGLNLIYNATGTQAFSISSWFYLSVGGGGFPVILSSSTVAVLLGINIGSASGLNLYCNGQQSVNASPPSGLVWHHGICINAGATTGSISVYQDGVSVGGVPTGTTAGVGTSNNVAIALNAAGNSFWKGGLADVAIWNVALTAAEAVALAQGARPYQIRPQNLQAWWPLDGLQSPEPDLSGFNNNGTLTGTALTFGPPVMMFTPRWPRNSLAVAAAGQTFNPAWALNRNRIFDGVAT